MKSARSSAASEDDAYYSDDPTEDRIPKSHRNKILALALTVLVGTLYLNGTFAANITLSSGNSIEFGQGVIQTVACAGSPVDLKVTPYSSFINSPGAGAHYLDSVKVSGIPNECNNKDFTIAAFGNSSSTPLNMYDNSSNPIIVYSNQGTFEAGGGGLGLQVTSESGSFTAKLANPALLSKDIFKITVQTNEHPIPCNLGGKCYLGDTSPGGGIIFYSSTTGFSCGVSFTLTCNYLEVAPKTWNGTASDPTLIWSNSFNTITGVPVDNSVNNTMAQVGLGLKNSVAINAIETGTTTAVYKATQYRGGGKSDWYLPTAVELRLLCQWSHGSLQNVSSGCFGIGTPNLGVPAGFTFVDTGGTEYYSSSLSGGGGTAWHQTFGTIRWGGSAPEQSTWEYRSTGFNVRPIRAF